MGLYYGLRINGQSEAGRSVSAAGDVNGDGFDDFIIGAYLAAAPGVSQSGKAYVAFGGPGGIEQSFNLETLDGTNGVITHPPCAEEWIVIHGGDESR